MTSGDAEATSATSLSNALTAPLAADSATSEASDHDQPVAVAFGLSRDALLVAVAVVAITCGQLPVVMYVR